MAKSTKKRPVWKAPKEEVAPFSVEKIKERIEQAKDIDNEHPEYVNGYNTANRAWKAFLEEIIHEV